MNCNDCQHNIDHPNNIALLTAVLDLETDGSLPIGSFNLIVARLCENNEC